MPDQGATNPVEKHVGDQTQQDHPRGGRQLTLLDADHRESVGRLHLVPRDLHRDRLVVDELGDPRGNKAVFDDESLLPIFRQTPHPPQRDYVSGHDGTGDHRRAPNRNVVAKGNNMETVD